MVQEQAITDPNGQLTLENLDFYTDYTVKTKIFYTMAEQEQSSEQEAVLESMRKFDLVYKKIEIKDIDAVTVYRRKMVATSVKNSWKNCQQPPMNCLSR